MANLYCVNCGNEWFSHDEGYEDDEPVVYGKCWLCDKEEEKGKE